MLSSAIRMPCLKRFASLAAGAAAAVAVTTVAVAGQFATEKNLPSQLNVVFPAATSFSPKEGNPPVFKAFQASPQTGPHTVAGFAFWTTDWQPFERGYDGPIKILVGMNMAGFITGIVVADHKEPYGYRSIDTQRFADQFVGKSIQDPFKLREDIDVISRATISVSSATRSIRDSVRRVAEARLPPGAGKR
jgi:transcriptional regulator of nitric oxide reductase